MEVTEGTTRLHVPRTEHSKGPKAKQGVPFYNPAMRTARDICALMLAELVDRDPRAWSVCDAMAAAGARGLRMAQEVPTVQVLLNDANPASIELAETNAQRLGLSNVNFRIGRLEPLLASQPFDWVDIDPFGTPAPFIDAAMLSVTDGGILAITATDMATLSGAYEAACRRRYGATPRRRDCMPELAVRILVGAIVRSAGRRDRGATPLLAYTTDHFARAYVRVHGGAKAGDASAAQMGHAWFIPDGTRGLAPQRPDGAESAGPLWTGPLQDPSIVRALADRAQRTDGIGPRAQKLLRTLAGEADAPPLYYTLDDLTRRRNLDAPRIERLLDSIRAQGHVATRTHFSPRGIKTTAGLDLMRSMLSAPRGALA
jgi:tRNA (guanine26-N2/guanine27-N2)-dimethyltransferase